MKLQMHFRKIHTSITAFLSGRRAKLLLLVVIVLSIPLTVFLAQRIQDVRQQAEDTPIRESKELDALTTEILQTVKKEQITDQLDRERRVTKQQDDSVQKLRRLLSERKEKMLALARTDPQAFLRHSLPASVRNQFSSQIRDLVEEEVERKGVLKLFHADDFKNKKTVTEYQLHEDLGSGKTKYLRTLRLYGEQSKVKPDSVVAVKGIELEKELVPIAAGNEDPVTIVQTPPYLTTTGEQKIAVIFFNFPNDTTQSTTREEIQSFLFTGRNNLNDYYKENSYQKTTVSGDIFGWYTIPHQKDGTCNYNLWANAADEVAIANGVPLSTYSRKFYIFPNDNCWASAWAYIGGNPSKSWFTAGLWNSYPYPVGVFAHELGHNLGVHHANTHECGAKSVGSFSQYFQDCTGPIAVSVEYGDYYATMGQLEYFNQFNAPHKSGLGWLNPDQVQTVTDSGVYSVTPLETTQGVKALKIAIPNTDYSYYVSYRRQGGSFDISLPPEITKGVSVHFWNGNDQSIDQRTQFVDAAPHATSENIIDSKDSVLFDNATFSDIESGISVLQKGHTGSAATVRVTIDKNICIRRTPELTVDPVTQAGNVGQPLQYLLTAKDTDSPTCPETTFKPFGYYVDYDETQGWSFIFSPQSLILSSGQEGSITVTSTSPVSAKVGVYPIQLGFNGSHALHSAAVYATHIIGDLPTPTDTPTPTPDDKPPSVTITSPRNGSRVQGNRTITADASDPSGITKVEFYVRNQLRCTDTEAPYACVWRVPKKEGVHYAIRVVAYDVSGNINVDSIRVTSR